MPRRVITAKEHDRSRSLGWLLLSWMEYFTVHGPGDVQGEPVRHGDEVSGFLVDCYALGDDGRRLYDSAFFSRPKGCDKSGLGGRLGLTEAFAPCRFAGWAEGGEVYADPWGLGFKYEYEPGEPMGRPVKVPYIRCMATEEGQPLALDTPVPTPSGWTTVEKLGAGDTVFNRYGKPVPVIGERPVRHNDPCYLMRFSDGDEIVSSAVHQWVFERRTYNSVSRSFDYPEVTVTTEQIAKTLRDGGGTARYRVKLTPPLELPEASLPVDPYILGLWLGDGKTAAAQFAYDKTDEDDNRRIIEPLLLSYEELVFYPDPQGCGPSFGVKRKDGFCPYGHDWSTRWHTNPKTGARSCQECRSTHNTKGSRTPTCPSLKQRLRDLGVLGHKHIPAVYLRASQDQRRALLQGLMDSDGSIDISKGRACYTTILDELAEDVTELLVTLGYKPSAKYRAQAWRIAFTPGEEPIFRLSRKVARQQARSARFARSSYRHVVAIERVPSVPVKCVAVDDPEHLFLVSRSAIPTHNTGLVYDTVHFNLTEGPLAEVSGTNAGLTRILLPGGGEITPSTASSASKDGGKETFVVF